MGTSFKFSSFYTEEDFATQQIRRGHDEQDAAIVAAIAAVLSRNPKNWELVYQVAGIPARNLETSNRHGIEDCAEGRDATNQINRMRNRFRGEALVKYRVRELKDGTRVASVSVRPKR